MIDLDFVTQGLHDIDSGDMAARLQARIDQASPDKYAAVVLAYALCNNGIVGVCARDIPVVQGCVLVIALIYVAVNLAVDLLYGVIDPRVRLS